MQIPHLAGILEYFLLLFGDAGSARPQRPHHQKSRLSSLAAAILRARECGIC
jgi:hypothetical protein